MVLMEILPEVLVMVPNPYRMALHFELSHTMVNCSNAIHGIPSRLFIKFQRAFSIRSTSLTTYMNLLKPGEWVSLRAATSSYLNWLPESYIRVMGYFFGSSLIDSMVTAWNYTAYEACYQFYEGVNAIPAHILNMASSECVSLTSMKHEMVIFSTSTDRPTSRRMVPTPVHIQLLPRRTGYVKRAFY